MITNYIYICTISIQNKTNTLLYYLKCVMKHKWIYSFCEGTTTTVSDQVFISERFILSCLGRGWGVSNGVAFTHVRKMPKICHSFAYL